MKNLEKKKKKKTIKNNDIVNSSTNFSIKRNLVASPLYSRTPTATSCTSSFSSKSFRSQKLSSIAFQLVSSNDDVSDNENLDCRLKISVDAPANSPSRRSSLSSDIGETVKLEKDSLIINGACENEYERYRARINHFEERRAARKIANWWKRLSLRRKAKIAEEKKRNKSKYLSYYDKDIREKKSLTKSTNKMDTLSEIDKLLNELEKPEEFSVKSSRENNNEKNKNFDYLLNYLDEVEKEQDDAIISQRTSSKREGSRKNSKKKSNRNSPNQIGNMSLDKFHEMKSVQNVATEVASKVLEQKLELDERERKIVMLEKALEQQRSLTVRYAKEAEKEMNHRLELQKNNYEMTIKRHLNFVDQLINDKKELSEKCEKLFMELKQNEKKFETKIKQMTNNHQTELKKLKDVHETAEKMRREKWIEEQTKKIKQMTVKGLEPEIQKLIANQKTEIQKLKVIHDAELLSADERAAKKYVEITEELRDTLEREKASNVQRERELAKEKYEKQLESEVNSFEENRKRLHQEVDEERRRLNQQIVKQRNELDEIRLHLEESHKNASVAIKREYEEARNQQELKHREAIEALKETIDTDKHTWTCNEKKKFEAEFAEKEQKLREQFRKDRDKDLIIAMERLEEDAAMSRENIEKQMDNRLRREREKYETEVNDLERSERTATEKLMKMKGLYNDANDELERLKSNLKRQKVEKEDLLVITETLQSERSKLGDVIREEFAERLVILEEDNRRLKRDSAEVKARHQIEMDRLRNEMNHITNEKDQELDTISQKIRVALEKKEEVVQSLRKEYEAAVTRADHLEGLLDQQRKTLLTANRKLKK
ncbi:hypothetical protein SNEBB_002637 [Seison nebaliae]|nr:hypothetical protein SNEBB_002637 [Seison nebaliae]